MKNTSRNLVLALATIACILAAETAMRDPDYSRPVPKGYGCLQWESNDRFIRVAQADNTSPIKTRMTEYVCTLMIATED